MRHGTFYSFYAFFIYLWLMKNWFKQLKRKKSNSMKTIFLMRHSVAEMDFFKDDKLRELTIEGEVRARKAGMFLNAYSDKIDRFLISSAVRTQKTFQCLTQEISVQTSKVSFEDQLYNPNIQDFVTVINKNAVNHNSIFLLSHNPAISKMVEYFTKESSVHMVEATIVKIDFEIDSWEELMPGMGEVDFFKTFD